MAAESGRAAITRDQRPHAVQRTSHSAQAVTATIARVNNAVLATGRAAEQVLSTATDLSVQAERLTGKVHAFVDKVRAASSATAAGNRRRYCQYGIVSLINP